MSIRTHTCGDLKINDVGKNVVLCGWVQRIRNLGGMTFIDLRDRYGITQLAFNVKTNNKLSEQAKSISREFVIKVEGSVIERSAKNQDIPTGDIEIEVENLVILNASKTPPFTIEDNTDGGEELRMKYRYLDIRRNLIKDNLLLRHKISIESRNYLNKEQFCEIETPYLIKSTPEGARDFIVPSRMNPNEFYALPQSPQTFKQLLMVSGIDKYYQIVKCFRDEDLRSDRQPEFTQIDCEMSFVTQEDILTTFEGLTSHLLLSIKGLDIKNFPRMTYNDAIKTYGTDKPDIRFDMKFVEMNEVCKNHNFKVFDDAELIIGICVKGGSSFTRKEIDNLTHFVKTPQVGGNGLIYCKYNEDGTFKSSVDKFFDQTKLNIWAEKCKASPGDIMLIIAGETNNSRNALSELRLHIATKLNLRDPNKFAPIWIIDFPLLEWDEEANRYHAMHHPFTSPKKEDIKKLETDPANIKADAYDLVLNGNEIAGGSIRIHDKNLQKNIFNLLGFTERESKEQFGFLMNAFEYGAPPHGGIAFGFDRLCAILGGEENIRDFIAFPKNNSGKDVMINSPSNIDPLQLNELNISLKN